MPSTSSVGSAQTQVAGKLSLRTARLADLVDDKDEDQTPLIQYNASARPRKPAGKERDPLGLMFGGLEEDGELDFEANARSRRERSRTRGGGKGGGSPSSSSSSSSS